MHRFLGEKKDKRKKEIVCIHIHGHGSLADALERIAELFRTSRPVLPTRRAGQLESEMK